MKNKKKADLLIDEIRKGIELRTKLVKESVYDISLVNGNQTVSNIFSAVLQTIQEYETNNEVKLAIKEYFQTNSITDETIRSIALQNNSKIKSVKELAEKVFKQIISPKPIFDQLILKCVNGINDETVSKFKNAYSPSAFVERINAERQNLHLKPFEVNEMFIPLANNHIDSNYLQDISSYNVRENLNNTIAFIKQAFNIGVHYAQCDDIYYDKKIIYIPQSLVTDNDDVLSACLKLMYVAIDNTSMTSLELFLKRYTVLRSINNSEVELALAKFNSLTDENKTMVSSDYVSLVNMLTLSFFARICLYPNAYKSVSVLINQNIGQLLCNLQDKYNTRTLMYFVAKDCDKNVMNIIKNLKIKKDNVLKLLELSGVTFVNGHDKHLNNILTVNQTQEITLNLVALTKVGEQHAFDLSKIDKNIFYQKCCQKYADYFDLQENSKTFVLNAKFDVVEQNNKITVIEQMCKDLNITLEQFENLSLEQSKIVIDAYAYSNMAQIKLDELRKKYFLITDEQLGLAAEETLIEETSPQTAVETTVETTTPVIEVKPVKEVIIEDKTKTLEETKEEAVTEEVDEIIEETTQETTDITIAEEIVEEETTEDESVKEDNTVEHTIETTDNTVEENTTEEEIIIPVEPTIIKEIKNEGESEMTETLTTETTIESRVATVLNKAMSKVINLLANKDLKQIAGKLKYASQDEIAECSMLLTGLNMLFNMEGTDKTVRNMFIAQNKTEQAKNLILLKNALTKQILTSLVKKVTPIATAKQNGFTGSDEQLVVSCLIELGEKHFVATEDERLAEIDVLQMYYEPNSFEYEDELEKINQKYFGNEEQAGKSVLLQKNLLTYMFNDIIVAEIRKIHRANDYKLGEKQIAAILDNAFVEVPVESNEEVK